MRRAVSEESRWRDGEGPRLRPSLEALRMGEGIEWGLGSSGPAGRLVDGPASRKTSLSPVPALPLADSET